MMVIQNPAFQESSLQTSPKKREKRLKGWSIPESSLADLGSQDQEENRNQISYLGTWNPWTYSRNLSSLLS